MHGSTRKIPLIQTTYLACTTTAMHIHTLVQLQSHNNSSTATDYAVRGSFSCGLSLRPRMLPSSEPVLEMLAKLQLSAVGVRFPESTRDPPLALWKSPKSPKPSNEASSTSSSDIDAGKEKGSEPDAAAESEKGPKASWRRNSVNGP